MPAKNREWNVVFLVNFGGIERIKKEILRALQLKRLIQKRN